MASENVDTGDIFSLLESEDMHVINEVKSMVSENVNAATEPWLLNDLVDYYQKTHSSNALEILAGIREPNEKFLFSKLCELMENNYKFDAIILLGHVARKQPSWMHKIVEHSIFVNIIENLKTITDISLSSVGLNFLAILFPIIPTLIQPFSRDFFAIFCHMSILNYKNSLLENYSNEQFIHLQVAIHDFFLYLYGLYPCSLINYLKSGFAVDKSGSLQESVLPLFSQVSLHPGLLLYSEEIEMHLDRWKNKEPHDILFECLTISLDPQYSDSNIYFNKKFKHFRNMKETNENNKVFGDFVKDSCGEKANEVWSPSLFCGLSTPPHISPSNSTFDISVEMTDAQQHSFSSESVEIQKQSNDVNNFDNIGTYNMTSNSGFNEITSKIDEKFQSQTFSQLPKQDHFLKVAEKQEQSPIHLFSKPGLKQQPFYSTLSPSELLDRHIQQGETLHKNKILSLPLTSSESIDWAHFGPPPLDEIKIMKTQLQIMHNQLLYEKHRRDIHIQHNRWLLGNTHQITVIEQQHLNDQECIKLLSIDNYELHASLSQNKNEKALVKESLDARSKDFENHLRDLNLNVKKLHSENIELLTQVKISKNEVIELNEKLKDADSKILKCLSDIKNFRSQVNNYKANKEEVILLKMRVILLEETLLKYKKEYELLSKNVKAPESKFIFESSFQTDLLSFSDSSKQYNIEIDACKSRIVELENVITHKDIMMAEQKRFLENMKSISNGKIEALENKSKSLRSIIRGQEKYIINLNKEIEENKFNNFK